MSDEHQTAEQTTGRRRVTFGEAVAVAGLIIAGLSLYLGFAERRDSAEERAAAHAESRSSAARERGHIGLVATEAGGDVLTFKGTACEVQSSDVRFPAALAVAPQTSVLDRRIDAAWFAKALIDAGATEGGRLPVLIESRCTGEDGDRFERAIYDLPYRIDSRFLRGRAVRLRGLVLREYVSAGQGQARLDGAWRALKPVPPKAS